MRTDIINIVINDKRYINYCKRVCNGRDEYKDLYQYIIMQVLEMDEKKLIRLYNEQALNMYLARVIYISINSKTSDFYRTFFDKIETTELTELNILDESDNSFNEFLDEFDKELKIEAETQINKGIYPSQVKLYEIYEAEKSYQKVANETGLKYKTVRNNINALRDKLIKRINDKNSPRYSN